MDARKLEFEDETIDLVIDKGTTDAVLCGIYFLSLHTVVNFFEFFVNSVIFEKKRCRNKGK